ncbi:hypothetical protein F7731_10425 [Cytobacillus depressus]|uniref:SLH domain-containing protein n=1 Tax=Cytobacillus depressus TaxID=1602942 RepID=A0A6L3V7R5_9BACI|nr:S-layer homology domain-containing protein [Cytobacillus depressus]KAB2336760.1 hypothetical protein F7731_10425 [Cytobacillus depressus]
MAQQSKNYKKFLATSMTAAMVASAIAPTAGFAAANFKDVPAGNFYFDYVSALANAKIIDGRPDGSFDLGGKINRAEASKMIANILKLDTKKAPAADFSDVDQTKWYAEFINALSAKGLINGKGQGKFDPTGTLTRGEFAKMVVEAYDLKLKADGPAANFKDVDANKWYAKYVTILFSHDLVTGTTATTFSPDAQIKRADFAKLLTETDWAKGSTLEKPNAAAPAVESVKAVNAKTIEVKFTKAVDAKTLKNASDADVITVVAGQGAKAAGAITQELSADGKTLTLKATNFFKGDYTVKVPFEIVKDVDGEFVKAVNAKVTVNDTTAPVLASATSVIKDTKDAITKITLTFDEEVTSLDAVKIDGKGHDFKREGNKVTVEGLSLDAAKSHEVTVVNAKDVAGNVKDVQTAPVQVTVDNVAPSVVSVVATGENTVKVTLDEELAESLKVTAKVGSFTENIVKEITKVNEKEYIVTLKEQYLFKNGNSDAVTLTFAKGDLKDEIGNTNAEDVTKTVTVSKDIAAPQAVKVETSETNGKVTAFSVTYNKEVANPTAAKISVVNSKGEIKAQDKVVKSVALSNDNKTVIFTLVNGLAADQYSLELAEGFVKDKALSPNNSAKYAFKVDVTEAAKPVETTFKVAGVTVEENVITVDFGAQVKAAGTGSALNAAAYQVNGVTLPEGTVIAFGQKEDKSLDQTKVEITLPAGFVKADDSKAIFKINDVQTLDNKVSQPFTTTIAVTDNTAPEAQSFEATTLTEVTVTYSEAIKLVTKNGISDEITLLDNKGAGIKITDKKVTADGKLVLTVAESSAVAKLVTNTVNVENADIQDAAGNAQKAGLTISK